MRRRVLIAEVLAIGCGILNWDKRPAEAQGVNGNDRLHKQAVAKLKSRIRATLGLVMVLAMSIALYRTPRRPPMPYYSGDRLITAGIWTMRMCSTRHSIQY